MPEFVNRKYGRDSEFVVRVQQEASQVYSLRDFTVQEGSPEAPRRIEITSSTRKDRYMKTFDPAVLAAMKRMETTLDAITVCAPTVHQINWGRCAKLLKARRGEVAERLNAAVC